MPQKKENIASPKGKKGRDVIGKIIRRSAPVFSAGGEGNQSQPSRIKGGEGKPIFRKS